MIEADPGAPPNPLGRGEILKGDLHPIYGDIAKADNKDQSGQEKQVELVVFQHRSDVLYIEAFTIFRGEFHQPWLYPSFNRF
jgi:hypothetical protein